MSNLVLTQRDVTQLLDPPTLLSDVRKAFKSAQNAPNTPPAQRVGSALNPNALNPSAMTTSGPPMGSSATVLFPGTLPEIPGYTVKVHAKFPGQEPAIRGLVLLHELEVFCDA